MARRLDSELCGLATRRLVFLSGRFCGQGRLPINNLQRSRKTVPVFTLWENLKTSMPLPKSVAPRDARGVAPSLPEPNEASADDRQGVARGVARRDARGVAPLLPEPDEASADDRQSVARGVARRDARGVAPLLSEPDEASADDRQGVAPRDARGVARRDAPGVAPLLTEPNEASADDRQGVARRDARGVAPLLPEPNEASADGPKSVAPRDAQPGFPPIPKTTRRPPTFRSRRDLGGRPDQTKPGPSMSSGWPKLQFLGPCNLRVASRRATPDDSFFGNEARWVGSIDRRIAKSLFSMTNDHAGQNHLVLGPWSSGLCNSPGSFGLGQSSVLMAMSLKRTSLTVPA